MNLLNYCFVFGILLSVGCNKDEVTSPPDIKDKRGTFDAAFENDFNYIYYKGEARYIESTDLDGQKYFELVLQDNKVLRQKISAEIVFNPNSEGLTTDTYYFNNLNPEIDSPYVAMSLRYGDYDFDEHKDLNFGIIYTSNIEILSIEDGVVKGILDAHLKCTSCPVLPYLISARFEAIAE